jgi:MPBQ/MSBQ methyltransferase
MLPKLAPRIKVNFSLRFCHQVLKLDHLTYGLWDGENLDLEGLRLAQARYSAKLLGWIPPKISKVLDVGCGVGENARLLAARGFEVEGLSPDPFQQQVFRQRTGLPFHLTRFENFEPRQRYDLVLMSESAQYLFLDRLFGAVAAAAPGGHLLIADYFNRNGAEGRIAKSGHRWEAFLEEAGKRGFRLEREEDITLQVLPTLQLATQWLQNHGLPAFELIRDTVDARYPMIYQILRKLLASRLRKIEDALQLIDPEAFARHKRYSFLLFSAPEN